MKLHDLKPAPGSRTAKRRVGRGIAAGQGKTAGRGTKGQKARAGGKIPAWFEGGQTPLHQRIPKLRGFRNKFKVSYEIVNVGDIARLVELGELESGEMPGAKPAKQGAAAITVNQEILRAAGLIRRLDRPMKVLGAGDLSTALFVVADAFSASARSKIEGAGGTVSVLEVPDASRPAIGVEDEHGHEEAPAEAPKAETGDVSGAEGADQAEEADQAQEAAPRKRPRASRGAAAEMQADTNPEAVAAPAEPAADEAAVDEPAPKARAPRKPRTQKPQTDA